MPATRYRAVRPAALGIRGLLMLLLGYLVWVRPAFITGLLTLSVIVILVLSSLTALAAAFHKAGRWRSGVLPLLLALSACLWPNLLAFGGFVFYGLWMLINAVIQLSFAVQLVVTCSKGAGFYLPMGLVSLLLSVEVFFHPVAGVAYAYTIIGAYFILYGLWLLVDMAGALLGKNVESSRLLSVIRVKPPVLLTALLPSRALKAIQQKAAHATADGIVEKPAATGKPKAYAGELEVVFHLGQNVAMGFGHVDIHFHGEAYSYGCYDAASNRVLGVISDGVFMVAPSGPSLDYARVYEHKYLVGYLIGLTADNERRVEAALKRTLAACQPWQPPAGGPDGEGTPLHCQRAIGSRYYKVQSGPFRYYNVFKTNCAAMAEILASESGLSLLPSVGAVTPGGYFSFLENELLSPASDVLRRTVYHPLKEMPGL